MTAATVLFYFFAAVAVTGALGLVLARELVHAVLWLFATLFAIAALYLLVGNEFLAAMQLFVYGGAITVLVLFVLMLTRPGATEPTPAGGSTRWIALALCAAFFGFLAYTFAPTVWQPADALVHDTAGLATILFSRYVLPFEIAGLVLTIALIGSVVLAREEPPVEPAEDEASQR